jgi:peroxiredoxin Q/BCP
LIGAFVGSRAVAEMKVRVGDEAPLFTAESVNKGKVSLQDLRGSRVLLVFGRYFGCPVCMLDFDNLISILENGLPGVEVIYLTQSSPESARKYIEGLNVSFPVIPVTEKDGKYPIYSDYGVGRIAVSQFPGLLKRSREARRVGKAHGPHEGRETQSPADFVIDEGGRVVRAHIGFLEPEKILALLRES